MPRTKKPKDIQYLLDSLKLFSEDIKKNVSSSAADVWKTLSSYISANLDQTYSAKYLYTVVKLNRFNCHEILNLKNDQVEFDITEPNNEDSDISEGSTETIVCRIKISEEIWLKIKQ